MPKYVDYASRFAFFEEATFTIVRDHGVDDLSRHRVAKVLGTSISTIRRLLSPHSDLRRLAVNEVEHRRRRRLFGMANDTPFALLCRLLPATPAHIAEELVWWRLAVAAPTSASVPPDAATQEEGPLHHRFAVACVGYVPDDVLHLKIPRPRSPETETGALDPVVEARAQRDVVVAETVRHALSQHQGTHDEEEARLTHALIDGLGVGVALGRLTPSQAVDILGHHLGNHSEGG